MKQQGTSLWAQQPLPVGLGIAFLIIKRWLSCKVSSDRCPSPSPQSTHIMGRRGVTPEVPSVHTPLPSASMFHTIGGSLLLLYPGSSSRPLWQGHHPFLCPWLLSQSLQCCCCWEQLGALRPLRACGWLGGIHPSWLPWMYMNSPVNISRYIWINMFLHR